MTPRCATLSKRDRFCPTAAGFLNTWLISSGGETSGNGVSRTSTKPSGSTHATPSYSLSTRFPTNLYVVSPKRCESLIRFSISHRTTSTRSSSRQLPSKPKAICHVLRLSSLPCIRTPTRHWRWKHRLARRSWRSEEHTSELQSRLHLVCRLLLEKKKPNTHTLFALKKQKQKHKN